MTGKSPATKAPPAPSPDAGPMEAPARARPKLSLHYGAKTGEERK